MHGLRPALGSLI